MKRAIGIVRVSAVGDRDGESFASPEVQADRIKAIDGLDVIRITTELDVSGGKPLAKREGLREAVEAIENGEAEVLVAAYFDRLFRSLKVQAEVVERVERAGGSVMAVDIGRISSNSAAEWISGTMLGIVSEYYRRSTGERVKAADARAVARGVPIIPKVPVGLQRRADGRLEPCPETRDLPAMLFQARLDGRSWNDLREILAARDVTYTTAGMHKLLKNRLYLGEIHYGNLEPNLTAHEPLVDRDIFERVQRMRQKPGPQPKSTLLLARLGVLRCQCGEVMVPHGSPSNGRNFYRCQNRTRGHSSIKAEPVHEYALAAAWWVVADTHGRAKARDDASQVIQAAKAAQNALDEAIGALTAAGLAAEPASIARLTELREQRDTANRAADAVRDSATDLALPAPELRELATHDEHRSLIRTTLDRITVAPDQVGPVHAPYLDRVEIWPRGASKPLSADTLRDLIEN